MPKLTVTIDEMSHEEAKAWVHAIADKYGTDIVARCLAEMEQRFAELIEEKNQESNDERIFAHSGRHAGYVRARHDPD